jgi:hypothetical protein
MTKQTTVSHTGGTFAKLYDVHQEKAQQNSRMGRPPKKVRRKPTTVHLTSSESKSLSKLQMLASEQFSVNRSELTGVAIEVLALIIEQNDEKILGNGSVGSLEGLRQALLDFVKS